MTQVVYLSGPMSGLPNLNFPAFHEQAFNLRRMGYIVINPAEKAEEGNPSMKWEDYMRLDIEHMMRCDTIFMLPNWAKSRGARLEHLIAVELGFTIMGSMQ